MSFMMAMAAPSGAKPGMPADNPLTPTEMTELFNGKDLAGWVSFPVRNAPADQTWFFEDGMIHCKGKPIGYLRTEKAYSNYIVTVEWRFTKAGTTGVLVHMNGQEKTWPTCVECQGMHAQQGDMYFWGDAKSLELVKPPRVARKAPDAEKPVGEWNTFQVVCDGSTVVIRVNDKEVNKITGCTPAAGHIGLQCEGAELEIRKVTLAPLSKKNPGAK